MRAVPFFLIFSVSLGSQLAWATEEDSCVAALHGAPSSLTVAWRMAEIAIDFGIGATLKGYDRAYPQKEFLSQLDQVLRLPIEDSMLRHVEGLWEAEACSSGMGRNSLPENDLRDSRLSPRMLPIAHVGMGIGATVAGEFEPQRIRGIVERLSRPGYQLFAYESVGAVLSAYKSMKYLLLGLPSVKVPDAGPIFAAFGRRERIAMSHGYGRVAAFRASSLADAVQEILAADFLDKEPAVQGAAFAYFMFNSANPDDTLNTRLTSPNPALAEAFDRGLVGALAFVERTYPGYLDHYLGQNRASSRRTRTLIARAKDAADRDQAGGAITPFDLELGDEEPAAPALTPAQIAWILYTL